MKAKALKSIAERVVHRAGAMRLVRARRRGQCRILMYHRFHGTPGEVRERLTRQCEHLRRFYRPMSMGELGDALRTNSILPENGVSITVDDGYRDLQLAFPVFQAFGFHVTVYVVSEFAAGNLWLWPDRVEYACRATALKEVAIAWGASGKRTFSTAAFAELARSLTGLPDRQRCAVLDSLPGLLGVEMPVIPPAGFEALTWRELRAMADEGLEIGAHTRTHPILSRLELQAEMAEEVGGCGKEIAASVGRPVQHFCYPNGTMEDYNEECVEAVRNAGYRTAVTTQPGLVSLGADAFQLNRIGVEPDFAPLYFERCVAGFRL